MKKWLQEQWDLIKFMLFTTALVIIAYIISFDWLLSLMLETFGN